MSAAARRKSARAGFGHAAPIFAALGDETRLAIVARLGSAGPQSIARLAEDSPYTRQAITKHLNVLGGAGLVRSSRQGRERMWQFQIDQVDEARRVLDEVSRHWDRALNRLKHLVEE